MDDYAEPLHSEASVLAQEFAKSEKIAALASTALPPRSLWFVAATAQAPSTRVPGTP